MIKRSSAQTSAGNRRFSTFQLFMGLIRYTPWLYSWNLFNWILITLVPILPGLVTKEFFDVLSGESTTGFNVATVIALLLASAMARVAAILVGFLSDVHFRFRAAGLLRRNMLEHILREPGAKAIPGSPGEAISQFRDDVEQVEEAVSWSVDAISMIFFAAVSVYILARIDAQMTLWVFLPLVVVVALAQLSTGWLQKYRAASREATSQVTGAISEMFTSVQAIQVAGAEDRVIGQFRELNDTRRKSMLKDKLFSQALDSVFSNTVNLGTGFILILAGQKMQNGTFHVGDFALFVYYLNFVTTFIQNFGKFLTYYKQSTVSTQRMGALLQGAPGEKLIRKAPLYLRGELPAPGEIASEAARGTSQSVTATTAALPLDELKVQGLSYTYPATGRGIQGIDFTLSKGSFTVVTGRIGSGKTTLVRTLLGLLPPDNGQVLWNGRQVEDPGNFFVPPVSAYTPQVPRLYSDTLTENILLGLPTRVAVCRKQCTRRYWSTTWKSCIWVWTQSSAPAA